MPINDLIDFIDKEFEENPVLEGEFKEGEFSNNDISENYKEMINYLNSNNYNSGINNYYGDEEKSVINIKNKIKELTSKEDKKKPISDQIICNILNEENFSISRRTVAKYREELGIKGSSKIKRI